VKRGVEPAVVALAGFGRVRTSRAAPDELDPTLVSTAASERLID
jgi:hypothetical protein